MNFRSAATVDAVPAHIGHVSGVDRDGGEVRLIILLVRRCRGKDDDLLKRVVVHYAHALPKHDAGLHSGWCQRELVELTRWRGEIVGAEC